MGNQWLGEIAIERRGQKKGGFWVQR